MLNRYVIYRNTQSHLGVYGNRTLDSKFFETGLAEDWRNRYHERKKMKNVTISLEEEVADWARIWAAKSRSSVSRLVGELLKQKMQAETGYQIEMHQFLSRQPSNLKKSGKYPSREALHERSSIC
jgi:hypothetical protein